MTLAEAKSAAFEARALYKLGVLTRTEASARIQPYVAAYNAKAVELARKYNLRPKKLSFASFVR